MRAHSRTSWRWWRAARRGVSTKLLVIVGATAVGKSALAMELARAFDGEIVSADSRQVYRMMDIGAAKPPHADLAAVPHHLIDIVNPDEVYSLALFLRDARDAIHNIKSGRQRLPIVVGGTGQYVWALLEGWQVSAAKPNAKLRAALEARATAEGRQSLYAELERIDPQAVGRIDANNPRRVIRALEVALSSEGMAAGRPRKIAPDYDALILGVRMERAALYRRIDDRIDEQIAAGWVDETRALLAAGYHVGHSALSGLGYGELMAHIGWTLPLADAVERIKFRTHRYARQQHNWFRFGDERIRWLDAPPPLERVKREVAEWLAR